MTKMTKWKYLVLLAVPVLIVLVHMLNPPEPNYTRANVVDSLSPLCNLHRLGLVRKNTDPLIVKKKQGSKISSALIYPNDQGLISIDLDETQCLELRFFPTEAEKRELQFIGRLPNGSSLDSLRGIFYWSPGSVAVNHHRLVFAVKEPDGILSCQVVVIQISPANKLANKNQNI